MRVILKARFAHAAEHPSQDAGERGYEKQKIDCDFHSRLHLDATLLLSALIVLFSSLRGLDLACSRSAAIGSVGGGGAAPCLRPWLCARRRI